MAYNKKNSIRHCCQPFVQTSLNAAFLLPCALATPRFATKIPCPLCGLLFPMKQIAAHADSCASSRESQSTSAPGSSSSAAKSSGQHPQLPWNTNHMSYLLHHIGTKKSTGKQKMTHKTSSKANGRSTSLKAPRRQSPAPLPTQHKHRGKPRSLQVQTCMTLCFFAVQNAHIPPTAKSSALPTWFSNFSC